MTQKHNVAISAIKDASSQIWNEHSEAIKEMLPLYEAAPELLEALKYQEFADADSEASRRKGYYEEARRLRRIAIAKAEFRE